jgi:hypothetical protein
MKFVDGTSENFYGFRVSIISLLMQSKAKASKESQSLMVTTGASSQTINVILKIYPSNRMQDRNVHLQGIEYVHFIFKMQFHIVQYILKNHITSMPIHCCINCVLKAK